MIANASGSTTGLITRDWYNRPWTAKITRTRAVGSVPANVSAWIAREAIKACANNHIGYSQALRESFYTKFEEANFDASAITEDCYCDCSSFVASLYHAAGIVFPDYAPQLANVRANITSTEFVSTFTNISGMRIEVNPKNDAGALEGDIWVATGHIAVQVDLTKTATPSSGSDDSESDIEQPETKIYNAIMLYTDTTYTVGKLFPIPNLTTVMGNWGTYHIERNLTPQAAKALIDSVFPKNVRTWLGDINISQANNILTDRNLTDSENVGNPWTSTAPFWYKYNRLANGSFLEYGYSRYGTYNWTAKLMYADSSSSSRELCEARLLTSSYPTEHQISFIALVNGLYCQIGITITPETSGGLYYVSISKNGIASAYGTETPQASDYVTGSALFTQWLNGLPTDGGRSGSNYDTDEGGQYVGGGGDQTVDNDDSVIPANPTITAENSGFVNIYSPTLQQVDSLFHYMWSNIGSLDTNLRKMFANPVDAVIGFSMFPFSIEKKAQTTLVYMGDVNTGLRFYEPTSQFQELNCGDFYIKPFWNGFMDYAPYTKMSLYLPFIGNIDLDVDFFMGKTMNITYKIDLFSGACIAYLAYVNGVNKYVYDTYVGSCACPVPINNNEWSNTYNAILGIAHDITSSAITLGSAFSRRQHTKKKNAVSKNKSNRNLMWNTAETLEENAFDAVSNVMNSKPAIQRAGSIGSTAGFMAFRKPFIIVTRPNQNVPPNQNHYTGFPCHKTLALIDCSGYTEIESIELDNISATDDELDEIRTLLFSGVYL